ncbi:hypothetical protein LIER_33192 [Lithospermum erythrorhizon]|uniref:Uncharacterized protein n=1 Tax=Lithospermum erythrorhizon TaxID=34254 RepID=A0AAV3RWX0_LITER
MLTEPWVSSATDFFLRGERGKRPRWVLQLINNGRWNKEEVVRCLGVEDSRRVLAIPLSLMDGNDKWIWQHTRCGNYFTCPGYKCAREMKKNGELRVLIYEAIFLLVFGKFSSRPPGLDGVSMEGSHVLKTPDCKDVFETPTVLMGVSMVEATEAF